MTSGHGVMEGVRTVVSQTPHQTRRAFQADGVSRRPRHVWVQGDKEHGCSLLRRREAHHEEQQHTCTACFEEESTFLCWFIRWFLFPFAFWFSFGLFDRMVLTNHCSSKKWFVHGSRKPVRVSTGNKKRTRGNDGFKTMLEKPNKPKRNQHADGLEQWFAETRRSLENITR